ncbi:unknown [Tropheryma whipplei str. Twist]|uniref:Uncharacterized protein n=2 Tax=Tropheryma whipplei TaxID=2039 RepID=Q83GN0_TROWT|nr:unknown [Tropheryma whipplei str. Twist]
MHSVYVICRPEILGKRLWITMHAKFIKHVQCNSYKTARNSVNNTDDIRGTDSLSVIDKPNGLLSVENLKKITYAYFLAVSEGKPMLVSRYLNPLLSRTLKSHTTVVSKISPAAQSLKFRVITLTDKSADVQIRFKNLIGNEMTIELTIREDEECGLMITRAGFGV